MIFVAAWYQICGVILMGASGAALGYLIPAIYFDWQSRKQWIKKELRITYWTMKQYETQAVLEKIRFIPMPNQNKMVVDRVVIEERKR